MRITVWDTPVTTHTQETGAAREHRSAGHLSQTTHSLLHALPGSTTHMSTSADLHQPYSTTSFASRQQARFITRAGVQVCCLRLRAFRGLHPPTSAAEGWGPPTPPQLTLPSRTTSQPGQWAPHRRGRGVFARTHRGSWPPRPPSQGPP